ncbi:HEAT repeat domain-containing protein [Gemmata sp. JC717]|uniref:HEAT repeat domain-containing protein n=1 Tax=Gemmata algarum TaxID=2975278 RepID=UPI0021BB2F52|nr:HEAT repeat domain-containing protein [Gemmata algarum]MDY3556454.1 HEAT repeat domain-containing protein [Gemmata algarum]
MSRTPIALVALAAFSLPALAGPTNPFSRKPRLDEAKAHALVETLKSDRDEKKRKAAADELGRADPRLSPEVAPALVRALRSDESASVRVEAAASLRELGEVYPQAAVALSEAAEGDSSPLVRLAAQRTLWEYHLSGYRAAKGGDGLPAQTVEPPIASPAGPRQAVALIPAPPVPAVPARLPPLAPTATLQLPAVGAQPIGTRPPAVPPSMPSPGPRLLWPNVLPGARAAVRSMFTPSAPTPAPPAAPSAASPAVPNLTNEPPVAKNPPRVAMAPSRPAPAPEPPQQVPDYVPTLPPFRPTLPEVVTPPWATPLPVPKTGPQPK